MPLEGGCDYQRNYTFIDRELQALESENFRLLDRVFNTKSTLPKCRPAPIPKTIPLSDRRKAKILRQDNDRYRKRLQDIRDEKRVVPTFAAPKSRDQYGTNAKAEDWAVFDAMLSKHTKQIEQKRSSPTETEK